MFVAAPWIGIFGARVKHVWHCGDRVYTFADSFDACFNDMIPAEFFYIPVGVFATPFFAILAFSIWAPGSAERARRWRFARFGNAVDNYPAMAGLASALAIWPFWRAASYPLWFSALPYILFWSVFGSWFLAAACFARLATKD
jgi:hypothetical protein